MALFWGMAIAETRPERNAFLNKKATSVSQVTAQVKDDGQVRDRYMRHFAMDETELLAYLGSLHKDRLSEGREYTVYSVPEGGYIKAHSENLRTGEAVFSDASGHPVLLLKCGNPLTLGPKQRVAMAPYSPELLAESDFIPVGQLESTPMLALAPVTPGLTPLPEVALTPPPLVGQAALPLLEGAPRGLGALLGFLPLLGVHSASSSPPTPPVPEPMTMAALGLGVAAMMAKMRRKV